MRSCRAFAVAFILMSCVHADAQWSRDCSNIIGIYSTPSLSAATILEAATYSGPPPLVTLYAVALNPYNESLGRPIETIGGFEFSLEVPTGCIILGATYPPSSVNVYTPPDFGVGTTATVIGGQALLATIQMLAPTATPGDLFMIPNQVYQSIPGEIALTDRDDNFSLVLARPSSGSPTSPVFKLWPASGSYPDLLPCLTEYPDLLSSLPVDLSTEALVGESSEVLLPIGNLGGWSDTIEFSITGESADFSVDDASVQVYETASTTVRFTPQSAGSHTATLVAHQVSTDTYRNIALSAEAYRPNFYVATTGDDSTGTGSSAAPWGTIQHAINSAATGDTINLVAGRFAGDGNRDLDFLGKGLVMRGITGEPADVVIDCGGSEAEPHIALYMRADQPAGTAISGITIAGSYASAGRRGAISLEGPSGTDFNLSLTDCVFESCVGGGVCTNRIGDVEYLSGMIQINRCTFGPGADLTLDVFGVCASIASTEFEGCGAYLMSVCSYNVVDSAFRHGSGLRIPYDVTNNVSNCILEENTIGFLGSARLTGCVIRNNTGDGIRFSDSPEAQWSAQSCDIIGNGGAGISLGFWKGDVEPAGEKLPHPEFNDCRILNNEGFGIQCYSYTNIICTNNVIAGNHRGGVWFTTGHVDDYTTIENCTIAYNGADGIFTTGGGGIIRNSIVAFNTGTGFSVSTQEPNGEPLWAIENSLVFSNSPDTFDSRFPVPGPGIISRDPLFCDPANDDYSLAANSPCAPTVLYDRMGALAVACDGFPAPVMMGAADVPDDQGGQVRLIWYRSGYDVAGSEYPVLGYDVYRQSDPAAVAARTADKLIGWDFVVRVPARGDQGYQVVAPTLWDSTIDEDRPTAFMVSAVTADPLTYFDSTVESGSSIDNLAPAAPAGVAVTFAATGNLVSWAAPADGDVARYDVWRLAGAVTPDSLGVPDASVTETTWLDASFSGSAWEQTYWIAAVDHAGNRGPVTSWDGASLSATPDEALPRALALHGNVPNPFNPSTRIIFDLPRTAAVDLAVYDVAGRLVRRLAAGAVYPAGQHEIRWAGRDDAGRAVAAGVYVTRLKVGSSVLTGRMTLVK